MGLFDFFKSDTERAVEDAVKDAQGEREPKGIVNEVGHDIDRATASVFRHTFESEEYNKVYNAAHDVAKKHH